MATRARIEAPVKMFAGVELSTLAVRAAGGAEDFFVVTLDGERGSLNFTPGKTSCEVVYGLRTDNQYEKPSFLGGSSDKPAAAEGLAMTLQPHGELLAFLEKLDAAAKERFLAAADGAVEWQPLLSAKGPSEKACFKVKVMLAGRDLTDIRAQGDGCVLKGSGWEFAKPLVEEHWGFRGARVKLSAKVHGIWRMKGKAGLSLRASVLFVRPAPEVVEADPFGDAPEFE